MTPTRVRDLFDLPAQIRKGDFVLTLGEGVQKPRETAASYVVTPSLAGSFDQALRLVGSALRDGRSLAAYLHGSFGSGKSHFMALLSLLVAGHEEAWRIPELQPLRDKHPFVGTKKLLQLHFHMIAQPSIEVAIFSRYIDHIRASHPDAPIPGLFADEQLFADARRMLDETRFTAYAQESRAFIDLDSGLAVMARHASELGYKGMVLFLDELILWLSHRASESAWLHNEVQKMVKLVEAQHAHRAIPIVSFIARQRNLAEMVGEQYAGAEVARLHDSLKHWEGRYDLITLEDRNLPAIVEKRVLKLKSPETEAKKTLDEAFEKLKRAAGSSWQTMLGQEDAAAFRKLYPFSPALVEALVALSNSLQRERTAIKLLMELLVEHIEDLPVGEVVGVGDLFDVLSGGEEPAHGVMKARFEAAKQLYRYQLLPLIQEANGTTAEQVCQRQRPGHPMRIGCSGCPQRACRTDNRLVKTLLISALVPEVAALKSMTASRLVQLNHGSAEDAFGRGVQAVVKAADVARAELDRRFARSLRSWVDSGKPATSVLPIEQAVRRIAVRFLEEESSRRLLVLLLDGMGWAQAADLLQSLSNRTAPWGPLAWHASAKGRIGEGAYPAVLASLPTITEVSRAAFFAGKSQPTGISGNTAKDVERWRSNSEVGKLLPAAEAPRLLLARRRAYARRLGVAGSPIPRRGCHETDRGDRDQRDRRIAQR